MIMESSRYHTIGEAYARVGEADALRRKPAEVVQHGISANGNWDDEKTLDGKINLRGRAAELRDVEVNRASHYDNIIRCYEYAKDILDRLEKDLDNEKEYDLGLQAFRLRENLESAAQEADDKLADIQKYEIGDTYHVGDRFSGPRMFADRVSHDPPKFG